MINTFDLSKININQYTYANNDNGIDTIFQNEQLARLLKIY